MSSPASTSHLNSSDSNEDQIYNLDSTLQSRMPNEGLPLSTFYGTKNLPSSDSPSKNLRARKLDFGSHSPDSDFSSVDSPVDDSDNDHHWVPKNKGSSSDDNEEPACTAPKKSAVPQVQHTKKRGRPAGSKNKKPRKGAPKKSKPSSISTPTPAATPTQASTSRVSAQASTSRDPSSPLIELSSRSTSTTFLPQVSRPKPVAKRDKGPGRKAKSDPTQWRRNQAKLLCATGQAYVSSRGKNVPAAKIGTKCTCKNKCLAGEYISQNVIEAVNKIYFELGDQPLVKDQYLMGLIKTRPVKRVRTKVPGKAPILNILIV